MADDGVRETSAAGPNVLSVNVGRPEEWDPKQHRTGIHKQPVGYLEVSDPGPREGGVARRGDLAVVAHIDRHGDGAELVGGPLCRGRVDVGDEHLVTAIDEQAGDFLAQPPRGAGDDGCRWAHRSPPVISPYSMPPWA